MDVKDKTSVRYKPQYTVGEVAELNHVTTRSLYHYQSKGMLLPSQVSTVNKYRYYSYPQFFLLDIIKRFKRCGVPLKNIADMIDKEDPQYAQHLLQKELETIQAEIDRLTSVKRDVTMFKSFYDEMPFVKENDDIQLGKHILNHVLTVPVEKDMTLYEADFALRTVIHSPLFHPIKFVIPFAFMWKVDAFMQDELIPTHRTCYLMEALPFHYIGYLYIEDADCLTITMQKGEEEKKLDRMRHFLKTHNLTPKYIFCEEFYDTVTNFDEPLRRVKVIL